MVFIFIPVVACNIVHPFSLLCNIPFCGPVSLFFSSYWWTLGWVFLFFAVTNSAAMNISAHVFWYPQLRISLNWFISECGPWTISTITWELAWNVNSPTRPIELKTLSWGADKLGFNKSSRESVCCTLGFQKHCPGPVGQTLESPKIFFFWLHWVFAVMQASSGCHTGSAVVHRLSCP